MVVSKNAAFCAELEQLCGAPVEKTDRALAETDLGRGAVKYKLTSAGFQSLYKALANEEAKRTGPRM
ncbi:hypothetical protein JI58_09915 [Marinosulfonomonas sp. PRT-SC04]|nr:hypothetical protein JI58_09915 [Marinosulfonomonas sp. PRT-SC04]